MARSSQAVEPARSRIALRRERRRTAGADSERWTAIQRAAGAVFVEKGYANATLEDVANAVGIDRSSLYYYVGTKAELVRAIAVPWIEEFPERLERALAGASSPVERIERAVAESLRAFTQGYPSVIIVLDQALRDDDPEISRQIQQNNSLLSRVLRSAIEDGVESGELSVRGEPRYLARGIVAMCLGVRDWWRPGDAPVDAVAETYAALVIDGLRRRG
jgi:TetR/AcrR family transcriptional regulator, cholesterol catabolism regulator